MTKKMKKSLMITSLLATSFFAFGAVASLNTVETKASSTDFKTTVGASVRINEPNGIRFRLELSEEKKNEIFAENSGKSLGLYIVRGNMIGQDYSTLSQKINFSFTEDDLYQIGNVWYANGVMTNLYVQNFNKDFVGVGYIATTDGEKTTYEYTQVTEVDNARSMSDVAIEAYKDPKANVQDEMVSLLEKAVYAEYGVVETRTTDGDTITGYSFTYGETDWTSYEAMQEDLPISLSVEEKDLTLGETLDLETALTVNGTKITGLDLPFTYSVESDAVTLENGVLTAVKEGTASVTVSFGNYTKTVEINVTERANVVFNPADESSASQISYNWVFPEGNQEFISAEENADETYGGAYMRSVASVNTTGNGQITLKPKFASYDEYDVITAWLYLKSANNTAVQVYFFDDADLTQYITPNQWVQVKIATSKFMEKVVDKCFCATTYAKSNGVTEIWLGEIVAENYDESTNLVFDPTAADTTKISATNSTVTFRQASNSAYATADYSGSYVTVSGTSNVNAQTTITPIFDASAYQAYDAVSAWLYIVSSIKESVKAYFLNGNANLSQTITTGYWKQVMIPMEYFLAWNGNGYFCSIKYSGTIRNYLLGEIKAVNYSDMPENVVYDPATFDKSLITLNSSQGIFNSVSPTFISADANTDTTYSGAYVKVNPVLSDTNKKTGSIYVTSLQEKDAYSSYTQVRAWIYIETGTNPVTNITISNMAYNNLATNQWITVDIPIESFFTNNGFGWNWQNNGTWGVTGIRIGEITAVK